MDCSNREKIQVLEAKFVFTRSPLSRVKSAKNVALEERQSCKFCRDESSFDVFTGFGTLQVQVNCKIEKLYIFVEVKNSRRKWSVYLKRSWSLKVSSLLYRTKRLCSKIAEWIKFTSAFCRPLLASISMDSWMNQLPCMYTMSVVWVWPERSISYPF